MTTPPKNKGRRIIKINAITQAKLIEAMLDGVYTCTELCDITGLYYSTVLHYCRELHRAEAAHICGWAKDKRGRTTLRIFKIGRGKDAKPKKLTDTERNSRYREKKKFQETIRLMVPVVNLTRTN